MALLAFAQRQIHAKRDYNPKGDRPRMGFETTRNHVANALRICRIEHGFSQVELAKLARIKPITLSRIETGKLMPSREQMSRLQAALGLKMIF
jgi:ribosome-binding protein aMBF1 (putative translation factor)